MNGTQLFRVHHQPLSLGFVFEAESRDGAILFTLSEEFTCKRDVLAVHCRPAWYKDDKHSMVPYFQSATKYSLKWTHYDTESQKRLVGTDKYFDKQWSGDSAYHHKSCQLSIDMYGEAFGELALSGFALFTITLNLKYEISVAPGVDRSLIVAVCICLREAERNWDDMLVGYVFL
jgi:hypothetical protein